MHTADLAVAEVTAHQVIRASHPLAAANHRQWIRWQDLVLKDPRVFSRSASEIIEGVQMAGIGERLDKDAGETIHIVERVLGSFAFQTTGRSSIVQRKLDQLTAWVEYAAKKTPADRERWLLQCRTPFLGLPPQMQESDYAEALADLKAVAEVGGLVLPEALPQLKPQTPRHLRRLRLKHSMGSHGSYISSEQPFSNICLGCHRTWGDHY
jgi:hypothetical protein